MSLFEKDRRRLSRILALAEAAEVEALARPLWQAHDVAVVKPPEKTLAMARLRETVENRLFNLGEVIVCEAVVTLAGTRGMAAVMGEDADKALHMAVIDAAVSAGVWNGDAALLALEQSQNERAMREHALHLATKVSFQSMDAEAPYENAASFRPGFRQPICLPPAAGGHGQPRAAGGFCRPCQPL